MFVRFAAIADSRTQDIGSWCLAKTVTNSPCNAMTSTTGIKRTAVVLQGTADCPDNSRLKVSCSHH